VSKAKQNTLHFYGLLGLRWNLWYSTGSCRNDSLPQAQCVVHTEQYHLGD